MTTDTPDAMHDDELTFEPAPYRRGTIHELRAEHALNLSTSRARAHAEIDRLYSAMQATATAQFDLLARELAGVPLNS